MLTIAAGGSMSAESQKALGQKNYDKFLKKLTKKPQSVATLAKKTGLAPITVRSMAQMALGEERAIATKVRNGLHYSKAPEPKANATQVTAAPEVAS
jgi:hypothetical protein